MWVWTWMFQGSVFIAMVLLLRLLLLDRLPKRAFSVMWTACTIQLLLPVGKLADFSYTSIFGLDLAQAGGEAMRQGVTRLLDNTPVGELSWSLAHWAYLTLPWVRSIHPVVCFWLLGALVFGAYFLAGHLRGLRLYRESLPAEDPFVRLWAAEHGDWRGVSVRVSDRTAAPLTYGVLRPVVVLPRGMDWENREALSYVLAHEFHHVRRWDALRKLGFAAALCVHWFNPLAWLMYAAANRDLELDCDESAADAFSWGSREDYARTLITMEERRSFGAPFASYFSRTTLEARVKALLSRKRCGGGRLALALLVVCVLALVGASPSAASRAVDQVVFSTVPADTPRPEPTAEVVSVEEPWEYAWVEPGSEEPAASEYVEYGSAVTAEEDTVLESTDYGSPSPRWWKNSGTAQYTE